MDGEAIVVHDIGSRRLCRYVYVVYVCHCPTSDGLGKSPRVVTSRASPRLHCGSGPNTSLPAPWEWEGQKRGAIGVLSCL